VGSIVGPNNVLFFCLGVKWKKVLNTHVASLDPTKMLQEYK